MPNKAKSSGKKYRKKGEWENIARNREAGAKTSQNGVKRIETVRMLSVEAAVKQSAGTGFSAKQKRRLGIS